MAAGNAVRASEARLRMILETAVDAFIGINETGVVESFTPVVRAVTNWQVAWTNWHTAAVQGHDGAWGTRP